MNVKRLPAQPDVVAPDGSDVRILLALGGGSMAHFELGPGQTSLAVRHRTVEELWYFLSGRGEFWRRDAAGHELVVEVEAGVSIDIPLGTTFQFRARGEAPLRAVGVTMPPWPGDGEAMLSEGPWDPRRSS
jgi:mannose-6-phosphate isomerase-like protein (cupin superfamily)